MASTESTTNGTDEPQVTPPVPNGGGPILPDWITEERFIDVLKENVDGFKKIRNFEARLAGGGGENYASLIVKVKVDVELEDGSSKEFPFLLKTLLQGEQGAMIAKVMGLFPTEQAMYSDLLPEFEQMYREVGKTVTFGPNYYRFRNDPGADYVLLEDISPRGFKNENRLLGLDQEHAESVLKLLAELHAASAVRFETKGEYSQSFMTGIFTEANREIMDTIGKALQGSFLECMSNNKITSKYVEQLSKLQDNMTYLFFKYGRQDPSEFNVILHADLWANNIMFRHNDEGKREETIFVDFQVSRYASPAVDLLYFLFSSTQLELKLSHFDNFIKYYHDHLVENLKLLNYPKMAPTLKAIHMQILRQSLWAAATASGVMAAALCDPNEKASFENVIEGGDAGKEFKMTMFNNPRYIKHMQAILPWLDTRGFLDF